MALRQELELTARGVKVTAVGCDISKHEELVKALDSYVGSGKPPIKGIIHAGMQLKVREGATGSLSSILIKLLLGFGAKTHDARGLQDGISPKSPRQLEPAPIFFFSGIS